MLMMRADRLLLTSLRNGAADAHDSLLAFKAQCEALVQLMLMMRTATGPD